jgi:anti-sigma factor RsiW
MMDNQQIVAGLSCSEVLVKLSEYLDGELDPAVRSQIEAHVRGCDWCARFGQEFSSVVGELRARLTLPEPLEEAVSRRLAEQLGRV